MIIFCQINIANFPCFIDQKCHCKMIDTVSYVEYIDSRKTFTSHYLKNKISKNITVSHKSIAITVRNSKFY